MELAGTVLGLGSVLLLLVVVAGLFASRQAALARRAASFACLLTTPDGGGRCQAGIAQYTRDRLLWWRTMSLSPRPARAWSRSELEIVGRQALGTLDEEGRPMVLLECRHGAHAVELTMSVPACSGLVSWLESSSRHSRRVL